VPTFSSGTVPEIGRDESGKITLDPSAMANLEYDHLMTLVAHEVNHPIIALPDPVLVFG
jgi:hypothetical protein